MRADLLPHLHASIDRLQEAIAKLQPMGFATALGDAIQRDIRDGLGTKEFSSPARMIEYLAELMMNTPATGNEPMSSQAWNALRVEVEDAFRIYMLEQFPPTDPSVPFPEGMREKTRVTLMAFSEYLGTGFIASTDQRRARLRRLFDAFEPELRAAVGYSIEDILDAAEHVTQMFGRNADATDDKIVSAAADLHSLIQGNGGRARGMLATHDRIVGAETWATKFLGVRNGLDVLRRERYEIAGDLLQSPPAPSATPWLVSTLAMGPSHELHRVYPSDKPNVRSQPLFKLSARGLVLLHPAHLYLAIEKRLEDALTTAGVRSRFLKQRDDTLEMEAANQLRRLSPSIELWTSVHETPDRQYEHDILVRMGNDFIVVEVKASPLRAPLRDPARAYDRIIDDFHASTGPGHAYQQALRLRSRLLEQAGTTLYGKQGEVILETQSSARSVAILCITDATYRTIGMNSHAILERAVDTPLPVMMPAEDLQVLLDGFESLGRGADDLFRFLVERAEVSELISGSDQLEAVALYLANDGLRYIRDECAKNNAHVMVLAPTLSRVFDLLYQGRTAEALDFLQGLRENPDIADASAIAAAQILDGSLVPPGAPNPWRDAKPDDACPCRSGKAYRDCHEATLRANAAGATRRRLL